MKKNLVLLLLFICSLASLSAQTDSSYFEVIKPEGEFYHSIINGHHLFKKRSALYWDDELLTEDSYSHPTIINEKVYITRSLDDDTYEILEIEVNGQLKSKGKLTSETLFITPYDIFGRLNDQLLLLDPETMSFKVAFDYSALSAGKESHFSLNSVIAISENEIALGFGLYQMGCYDFDTYIIHTKTGEIIYNNQYKGKENWTTASKFCPFLKDDEKKEYYVYRSTGHDQEGEYYIFNADFSIRRPVVGGNETLPFQCTSCEYGTFISGVRVENNKLKYVYLGVYYYEGYERIEYFLPYKFDSHLWHLIDQVFNDRPLYKSDIQKLDFYQLSILKNSVFAKHNYQFNSDFYKAYFSLFAFYANAEAGKTRTKNVNALLTENDQSNLKLIFSAIQSH
ncbi:MAG: hypothetical protein Roseis2KO_31620 [Roseivirga sp.]